MPTIPQSFHPRFGVVLAEHTPPSLLEWLEIHVLDRDRPFLFASRFEIVYPFVSVVAIPTADALPQHKPRTIFLPVQYVQLAIELESEEEARQYGFVRRSSG